MTMGNRDMLSQLSQALADRAAAARTSVAAIRSGHGSLSAVVWQNDAVVSSAQSLPECKSYEVVSPTGVSQEATLAGVDAATNVAVLRVTTPLEAKPLASRMPRAGELIAAYGADLSGGVSQCASWQHKHGGSPLAKQRWRAD
jgi:hypothetical protein